MRQTARNADIGTNADANTHFFFPRGEGLTTGLRVNLLPDSIAKLALPSVAVGGLKQGKPRKGTTIVPALLTDRPVFNRENKLIRASVTDQDLGGGNSRKVLVSHKEGTDWLVLVRTGFNFGPQGLMGDYMDLLGKGITLKSHGSFNFDKKGGAYKIAEGREEKADFGTAVAERIGHVHQRRMNGLPFSPVDWDFWRVPEGGVVIVRDVTGQILRLIGGKTQLLVQDATGYDKFFDRLLEDDIAERKKLAAATASAS